jgi:hypothetical protein
MVVATAAAVVTFSLSARAASLASDNASDAAYSGGVINGNNGGTGWGGAWVETAENGPNGSGSFIGDSTSNAGGGSGGINSVGNKAWGTYANTNSNVGGNTVSLVRPFTGDLSIGQTFSIDFDNGWIDNGTVGLGLQNAGGQNRVEFFFVGGGANYTIQTASGLDTGIGFTGNGLHLDFVLTGTDSMDVKVTPLNPTGSTSTFSVTLNNSGGIDRVRLFNYNSNGNGNSPTSNYDAFYNNMSIIPEPTTFGLVGLGLLGALALRRRK